MFSSPGIVLVRIFGDGRQNCGETDTLLGKSAATKDGFVGVAGCAFPL